MEEERHFTARLAGAAGALPGVGVAAGAGTVDGAGPLAGVGAAGAIPGGAGDLVSVSAGAGTGRSIRMLTLIRTTTLITLTTPTTDRTLTPHLILVVPTRASKILMTIRSGKTPMIMRPHAFLAVTS